MAGVDITFPTDAFITEAGSATVTPVWVYMPTTATVTEAGSGGFPVGIIWPEETTIHEMGGATRSPYVYVVDSGNNRINAYDYAGNFKFSFGSFGSGAGQFNNPYAVTEDGAYLYVTDSGNHRVQIFTMFGVYVGEFGTNGTANGKFDTPMGIAVDDRWIWVVDHANNRFQVFDLTTYAWLYSLGEYGSGENQFDGPTDCEVDELYFTITDAGNSRLVRYPKTIYDGGTGSGSLPALTSSGTAYWPSGRGAGILPEFEMSSPGASGVAIRVGYGHGILPAIIADGSGLTIHIGSGTPILPAFTADGSGLVVRVGSGAGILPALEASGNGIKIGIGSGAAVLPALIISANGYVVRALPVYQGVAMNMRNKAITTYSGYDFNSLAVLGDKTYGANENGVYLLEGSTDNGTNIDAYVKTGTVDLHDPTVQRIVDAWLSGRVDVGGVFTVYEDEETEGSSEDVMIDDALAHDERVKLPQGLKGRFVAFEFANSNGSDFDLTGLTVRTRDLGRPR